MIYSSQHPAIIVAIGSVLVFGFFYGLGRFNLRGSKSYHFDPGGDPGAFEPHSARYQDIAKLVITLATASAAFVFNFLINIPSKGVERGPYSFVLEGAAKLAVGSFSLSVVGLLAFMIWQTYSYEVYRVPGNAHAYTANRYAISLACGFSGLFWFLAGYGWLAWAVFRGDIRLSAYPELGAAMTMKQYLEVAADVVLAGVLYILFGWIGFALWVLFVLSQFAVQLIRAQQTIMSTLLSRLPDRCAFCHREIIDEGGIFDDEGIYHEKCIEKLETLESLRREAGVQYSEAIHRPRQRKQHSATGE